MSAEERNALLEPFFSGTLTFLYRLLFLLYAESRDLLSVREVRGYYEQSLEQVKKQIAAKAGTIESEAPAKIKAAYNEISTAIYDGLQELFQAIDKGDAALNVPVYIGDLPVFGDATTYPIIILSSQAQRNASPIEYALLKTLGCSRHNFMRLDCSFLAIVVFLRYTSLWQPLFSNV